MAKKLDVDPELLDDAAKLIAEIGAGLAAARDKVGDILQHTETACGDDHFGHQFADGPRGFRNHAEAVEERTGRISEIVTGMAEGAGLGSGAAQALRDTDESSRDMFGR